GPDWPRAPAATAVRVEARAGLGPAGVDGLVEKWATRPKRARACSIAASAAVRLPVAPGAITGGADVRPSLDYEVCNMKQSPKSGSATVARDWATRRSVLGLQNGNPGFTR